MGILHVPDFRPVWQTPLALLLAVTYRGSSFNPTFDAGSC